MITRPRPLRPGDRVAIVSPAGPVLDEHVRPGMEQLAAWGLEVEPIGVLSRHSNGYLAGDDDDRRLHLEKAFNTPEIRAVICSRGGYGVMRILQDLDITGLREDPKLVVGFSDITALHLYLAGAHNIATLHAPVAKSFGLQSNHLNSLKQALFGERRIQDLHYDVTPVAGGRATGRMLGGNLSLVASLVASPFCPPLKDVILLLEDVGEADYRLDRLFTTLRLAQSAQGLAGIVLGDFIDCGGVYVPDHDIPAFVQNLAREFGVPVVAGFPSGHGVANTPVPMGVQVEIDGSEGWVRFAEDAVR